MRLVVICSLSLYAICFGYAAFAAEPPPTELEKHIPKAREMIGKSLLEQALKFSNESIWVLAQVTPQGATFFNSTNTSKRVDESFESLRRRAYMSMAVVSCPGSKTLDSAKISSIIVWEAVQVAEQNGYQPSIAVHLQRLLELMTPPAVSTPSSVRAPRTSQLGGPVFEFVRGDTTETVSLLNDLQGPDQLRLSWQITNNSYCPKQ